MPRKKLQAPKMKGVEDLLSMDVSQSQPHTVSVDSIRLPVRQPRRYFDEEKLAQLTASVKEYGILEPLLVRPLHSGLYELVAGERRLRAAQQAQFKDVPIISRELTDKQAIQLALIENLQREDLNPVEETEGVLDLLSLELDLDRDAVVALLHRSETARRRGQQLPDDVIRQIEQIDQVFAKLGHLTADSFRSNRLPILNLPLDVLSVLQEGKIAYTKALTIARLKDKRKRTKLLKEALDQKLSLSEIRARLQELMPDPEQTPLRVLSQRWNAIGKQLKKSDAWRDRSTQERITELLDELEQLTAKG
jgi:ParB family chromosome partitioning protein